MGLNYIDLSLETRLFMLAEISLGWHYESPRLNVAGKQAWPSLIKSSAESHSDDWLAAQLLSYGYLNYQENYVRSGKPYTRDINRPHASMQLAEGEFNRFFIRGLCRFAIENGMPDLIVYRAKQVREPRPDSELRIGARVPVHELLESLRSNDFVSIADFLKVPGGPNSGISARLPPGAGSRSL